MVIAGCDPGYTGAITFLRSGRSLSLECLDIPTSNEGSEIDYRAFRDLLRVNKPDWLYFENVHAFKMQGVVAAGRFMKAVGALEAIAACEVDNCRFVTPKKWKTRFGLLHTEKTDARNLVMGLFPQAAHFFSRVKDHNRADSALIAIYGAERCDMLDLVSRK